MAPRKNLRSAATFIGIGLVVGLMLAGCGLGRDSSRDGGCISDPVVAATFNGRPFYNAYVRAHAVARGFMQEGEDLDANSDAFFVALEELIQFRLFSMEAEARGLDRQADVRRQLENARERVLAASIYEEIDQQATNPSAIRRLYDENAGRLGQGTEVHLRHMEFTTRELADAAKRRLDSGERFEALAFELSSDRETAPDGGDLGWGLLSDVHAPIRSGVGDANPGEVVGPIEFENHWHIVRLEDRRERGVPSLEELRPRIVDWLRFQEITRLQERLERDARIERLREQDLTLDPGEETPAPADAAPAEPVRPAPDAASPPGQAAPPFPFPMGPGGVVGAAAPTPQQAPPRPRAAAPAPVEEQSAGDGASE
jgi:peptidyl-prolyl cis-trans isomerase C